MKKKTFKHGRDLYRMYLKPVGRGFEVGLVCGAKTLFVGNFIYTKEAQRWYALMLKEYTKFSKKYWITPDAPRAFYQKFLMNHMYKLYYDHLDRCFGKYNRVFKSAVHRDNRRYNQLRKNWNNQERFILRRAA